MAVVRDLEQRIVMLSQGRIIEQGNTETVCSTPAAPYTRKLLDAVLLPDPMAQRTRAKRIVTP